MALNEKQLGGLGLQEYLESSYYPYTISQRVSNNSAQRNMLQADRAEAREIALAEALDQSAVREAQLEFDRDTSLGPVVKPRSNTLRGYKWMLREADGTRSVQFNQRGYGAFDGIIVQRSGVDEAGQSKVAAFNPEHPHYQDFAPLRRNIALLRNYLLTELFEDGNYIPNSKTPEGVEDLAHFHMLNQMAERLGDALASNTGGPPSFLKRWSRTVGHLVKGEDLSTPYANAFMEAANIPDKGALVMYNYLQGLHETPSVKDIYSKDTPKNWKLPPREETPFSDENVRLYSRSSMQVGVADAYEYSVMSVLRAPENLKVEDRVTSVEIARDILERLKNLMANPSEQERMSQFTDEDHDKSRKLLQVAMGFRDALAVIADADPEAIQQNKIIARSYEALEQLGYRMKIETHKMLVEEYEPSAAKKIQASIEETPKHYKTNTSSEELLSQVDSGLKEAARIQQQAKIAAKIAARAARRAQQQNTFQSVRNSRDAVFSKATVRGSSASAAKFTRELQDKAFAAEKADAPLLNPDNTTRGR